MFRHLLNILIVLVCCVSGARAATLVVNTTADTFIGTCTPFNCSLKDAVFVAESTSALDDIVLQNCATYTILTPYETPLTGANGLPRITTPIRILGNGAMIERSAYCVPFGGPGSGPGSCTETKCTECAAGPNFGLPCE